MKDLPSFSSSCAYGGGTSALSVYLSGDADTNWRLSLLTTESRLDYDSKANVGDWTPLVSALPWGHTLVGPFSSPTAPETRRSHAGLEQLRTKALKSSDFVFAWLSNAAHFMDAGLELGAAYSLDKPIILAVPDKKLLAKIPRFVSAAWKVVVNQNVVDAYELVTADMDVTFEKGFSIVAAGAWGRCVACQSSYHVGQSIYWSKQRGGYHEDCYVRAHRPENVSAALFNAELIQALREENARLEYRLEALDGNVQGHLPDGPGIKHKS